MFEDTFVFATVEPLPFVSISSSRYLQVSEGNDGERYAVFKISLSGASVDPLRVRVDTHTLAASDWATEGQDCEGVHRTLTFNPGELTKTVKIKIFGDTDFEANEFFGFRLSNVQGAQFTLIPPLCRLL